MTENDLEYYSRRADQERRVAVHCADTTASHAHRSLARAYDALIADASGRKAPFIASGPGNIQH